jgi:hypothetical protein
VAEDLQLDVLSVQVSATPNECVKQSPDREVDERKATLAIVPALAPSSANSGARAGARHEYWRPSGVDQERGGDPEARPLEDDEVADREASADPAQ